MSKFDTRSFKIPEFFAIVATLATTALFLHPIVAAARTESAIATKARRASALSLYAVDSGAPGATPAQPFAASELLAMAQPYAKGALKGRPNTGCMPITRFAPTSATTLIGLPTVWEGRVANPGPSGCSMTVQSLSPSILALNGLNSFETDPDGSFRFISLTLGLGKGTLKVVSATGAASLSSVNVQPLSLP